jgi:hypothetical protein
MFFSSPSLDLEITIFLTVFVIVLSLVVFIFSKKKLFSLFLASLLLNFIFLIQFKLGSLIFRIYDILWLQKISIFLWPIINLFLFIILIFIYVKNIKKNKK